MLCTYDLTESSPTDEVSGRLVSKGGIACEAYGSIEECGCQNAIQCGLLHLCVLSRVLDRVLQIMPLFGITAR